MFETFILTLVSAFGSFGQNYVILLRSCLFIIILADNILAMSFFSFNEQHHLYWLWFRLLASVFMWF